MFIECGFFEIFCLEGYKFYFEFCFCLKYFFIKWKLDEIDLNCWVNGVMYFKYVNGKVVVVCIDS